MTKTECEVETEEGESNGCSWEEEKGGYCDLERRRSLEEREDVECGSCNGEQGDVAGYICCEGLIQDHGEVCEWAGDEPAEGQTDGLLNGVCTVPERRVRRSLDLTEEEEDDEKEDYC